MIQCFDWKLSGRPFGKQEAEIIFVRLGKAKSLSHWIYQNWVKQQHTVQIIKMFQSTVLLRRFQKVF